MHGTITLAHTALKNRRGRKRKQGRRSMVTGDMVKVAVDYRALAGAQPHRVVVPERFRLDERAGTELGTLLLTGRLAPHGQDGKPSDRAKALHEAGRRYAGIVSRYRAMIGSPRTSNGAGKGYACLGEPSCGLDPQGKRIAPCECRARTLAYNDTFSALEGVGHQVHVVVNLVAIHDEPSQAWQLPALIIGLGTLARAFGLKS